MLRATLLLLLGGLTTALSGVSQAAPSTAKLKAIAEAWIRAVHQSRDDTWFLVRDHMAEEGVYQQGRYVGLGVTLDSRFPDDYVIKSVAPSTPAARVLLPGDKFLSIDGLAANRENRNKLAFRGPPNEPVMAEFEREGRVYRAQLQRGVIEAQIPKAELLKSIARHDAGIWAVNHGEILEVISEGRVVYVSHEIADVDEQTGLTFYNRYINRFEFNDADQVIRLSSRGESRFVLEQLGYQISR